MIDGMDGYFWANGDFGTDGYFWANGYLWADGYLWANGLTETASTNVWVEQE